MPPSRLLYQSSPHKDDRIYEDMRSDFEEQVHRRMAQRFEALQALYRRKLLDHREPKVTLIARDLNRELNVTFEHLDFLNRHRLVLLRPGPPELTSVLITHDGEVAVERVVSGEATPDFPVQIQKYLPVGQMPQSQIQHGTESASAAFSLSSFDGNRPRFESLLRSLRKALDEPGLDRELRAEMERDLTVAEEQMKAAKPDRRALRERFQSIRSTAKRADGTLLANDLPLIIELLRTLV